MRNQETIELENLLIEIAEADDAGDKDRAQRLRSVLMLDMQHAKLPPGDPLERAAESYYLGEHDALLEKQTQQLKKQIRHGVKQRLKGRKTAHKVA